MGLVGWVVDYYFSRRSIIVVDINTPHDLRCLCSVYALTVRGNLVNAIATYPASK